MPVAPPADRVPSVPRKRRIHLGCPSRNRCCVVCVVSAVLAFALENNSWIWGGLEAGGLGGQFLAPSAFSRRGVCSSESGFVPRAALPRSPLWCLHSSTEIRCICSTRMSQSTDLFYSEVFSNSSSGHQFVLKAKENLTSKWLCEL